MADKCVLPSISIVIPTLNAFSVLQDCLESIMAQDYPKGLLEIIITDGGSTDGTLETARKYGAKIYENPLKTGEAGKSVGVKKAGNELIALIDSDNLLTSHDWLRRMIEPFSDPEIVGSEPWKFTYRMQDGFIDRYCALLGMNDPLCYFLGNYDRLSTLTGRWTGLDIEQEDKGAWIKVTLDRQDLPTIGANGTIFRREILTRENLVSDYFFDIDIIAQLAVNKPIKFAKVKVGIIHFYCGGDIRKFVRKQKRRITDYCYYKKMGIRSYPWHMKSKAGVLIFALCCILILPLIYQSVKGYAKRRDPAWFFHPLACWITLSIYVVGKIKSFLKSAEMSRESWGHKGIGGNHERSA